MRVVLAIGTGACTSFDDFVGAGEYGRRNLQANLFRRFEVDDYPEFRRLLYWQITGFCTFENLVNISRCSSEKIRNTRSIRDKSSNIHKLSERGNFRKSVRICKIYDLLSVI
jgi:hypothetical protein